MLVVINGYHRGKYWKNCKDWFKAAFFPLYESSHEHYFVLLQLTFLLLWYWNLECYFSNQIRVGFTITQYSKSRSEFFPLYFRYEFVNLINKAQTSGCMLLKLDSCHSRQFAIWIHNHTFADNMICRLWDPLFSDPHTNVSCGPCLSNLTESTVLHNI